MRGRVAAAALMLATLLMPMSASAHPSAAPPLQNLFAPRLESRDVELGFAGSITSVEGTTSTQLAVRGGSFLTLGSGLMNGELELGWISLQDLDLLDVEAHVGWGHRLGQRSVYAFAGLGGGVRQEWLGSFRQSRYPLGLDLGLRVMVAHGAMVRLEYRLRRVLDDPVNDFNEHRVLVGLSLVFPHRRALESRATLQP